MSASLFKQGFASLTTLMLPDFDCGGPGYWQHDWAESRLDCRPVELGHALTPDRNSMVAWLDRAIRQADAPVMLVGHGMGALTIAAWAGLMSSESEIAVVGALLVGPSDPATVDADARLQAFAPLPSTVFSFPALVIASDDDAGLSPDRAFSFARQWGAGYALMEGCGRFRPADGLGRWPAGEAVLDRFVDLVEPGRQTSVQRVQELAALCEMPGRAGGASLFRP